MDLIVHRTKRLGHEQFGDKLGARKKPALDLSKAESDYLCAHKEFCEMLSKCKNEYEYAEERSEDSRRKYANLALKEYNEDEDEDYPYELVKPGPLALGSLPKGWQYRMDYFSSVVAKIDNYVRACKEQSLNPISLHPAVKFIYNLGDDSKSTLANVALHTFNDKKGKKFELVKVRCGGLAVLSIGFIHHINFEAKDKNDPEDAPMQMFFAEVIYRYPTVFADFCISLGSSTSLPDEADMCGCCYCDSPVHHPSVPGYITGGEKYLQE